ncbi:MAG TPA: ribbon-helix-helix protein, CopG family [Sedimenticola sp.]|nr:ribbon-helix-helix protein, CopG family [Sedimenticola sp.]
MAAISIRLPEELEARLSHESDLEGKPRSEVAREAIAEYLARREKERFMAQLAAAAKALAANPAAVAESLEIANDFDSIDEGLDAIIESDRAAGIDPNQKWWK